MKKNAILAVAAAAALSPFLAAPAFADDDDRHWRHGHHSRHYDDWRDDRRDERRAYREGYREGYWDGRQHNGYYYRDTWHWGPPPSHYYGHHSYRPGYVAWREGHRVPRHVYEHWRRVDYRHHHRLYPPPRGYHWVEDDRGDYLLVGLATGVILGAILAH